MFQDGVVFVDLREGAENSALFVGDKPSKNMAFFRIIISGVKL
jgi:hypothetical protein